MHRSQTALAALMLLCTACQTATKASERAWLEPSPQLKLKIEEEAQRLPWTHGLDRVQLIHWFASVGEPAYPTLLDMVSDARTDVAGSALAALGATRDSRLVEPLHAIPWPHGPDSQELVLERARTLVRLGDWSVMPILIEGLRDDALMTRALCFQALSEATRERFDYDPRGGDEERAAAVERWQVWWAARSGDPLLAE
jgi:hypothetical protein